MEKQNVIDFYDLLKQNTWQKLENKIDSKSANIHADAGKCELTRDVIKVLHQSQQKVLWIEPEKINSIFKKANKHISTLIKMADALDVSLDELVGRKRN